MLRDFFLCTVVRHCLMRNFTHRWFSGHSYHRVDFCRPACLTRVPNGSKIIQLFRQRLSRISIKAYATIPIGIVGAKSLVFSRVRFKVIQQQGTRKNEYTCLCCFFPPRWNTLWFIEATVKTTITHNNLRHCRVSFSPFVRQPFSKQLYICSDLKGLINIRIN